MDPQQKALRKSVDADRRAVTPQPHAHAASGSPPSPPEKYESDPENPEIRASYDDEGEAGVPVAQASPDPASVSGADAPGPSLNIHPPTLVAGNLLTYVPGYHDDCSANTWSVIDCSHFNVRGTNYLADRKKFASRVSGLDILAMDFANGTHRIDNITAHPKNPVLKYLEQHGNPFLFTMNFQQPTKHGFLHLIIYATIPPNVTERLSERTWKLFQEFLSENTPDSYRTKRFKLIPNIAVGPWLAKKAAGNKPSIIGNNITSRYFRGPHYMEVGIDVGSSQVGKYILSVVSRYVKNIVVDLAFLIEGQKPDELPEQVLAGVRIFHADLEAIIVKAPLYE
eukprot:TRINITY_DN4369_c0_g1_i1.p1 TRINITY_DN4369_c0_g1~~TRINITY_DN4369_c0_g1_i1.p1  ORF type:complete len:339 (-),score=91.95 TRINITY_DN4369_c0_g1_i1:107-1123(-)